MLGAMLVAEPALTRVIDEVKLNAEDSTSRSTGDLPLRPRPRRRLEAGRRAERHRGAGPAQRDRGGRRQALRLRAGGQGAGGRQRQALRRDRPAELAAAAAARRRPGDPGLGARARRRTARALRAGREAALRRRPQRAGERLPPALGDPPRRGRPAREALHRRAGDDRHPLRLPRHRRDHRRLPAGQPDHRRRPPGDGQERAGRQHRRERRREAKHAGRLLLPGDVGGGAGAALHRLPGADLRRQAAQGTGRAEGMAEGGAGLQRAGGGAAVVRRLLRPRHPRPAGEGAAAARAGRRTRAASAWSSSTTCS